MGQRQGDAHMASNLGQAGGTFLQVDLGSFAGIDGVEGVGAQQHPEFLVVQQQLIPR